MAMKWRWVLLTFVLLVRDSWASDEDAHPNALEEVHGVDLIFQPGRLDPDWDLNKDDYEDADWHPPSSLLETHADPSPDDPPESRSANGDANANPDANPDADPGTFNQTVDGSSAPCGEFSGQLTSNGQCRLVATLPPVRVGMPQQRCPDVFRCTDDISHWLHENQNRREQLEELRNTMKELQEELRSNHDLVTNLEEQEELRNNNHQATTLEGQGEDSVLVSSIVDVRLRREEQRRTETDTLLHVHAELLQQLQESLRPLSDAVQRVSRNTGCTVAVVRTQPLLGQRDALPPGRRLSLCPSDCASLYHSGVRHSGVYTVILSPGNAVPVYCDMETDGGGWTVFQRRRDGSVSFDRGWVAYRDGFGEPRGELWLGNRHLHLLTTRGDQSLRIHLQDWSHAHKHAQYRSFRIENEENRFRLHVSGFSGTAEDSFSRYHDRRRFSTPDTGDVCAEVCHAGWWFHQCFHANLNGVYYQGGHYTLKAKNLLGPDGIVWFSWKKSDFYSLKAVTMMVRPRHFRPRSPL